MQLLNKRILITGASGMLGQFILKDFEKNSKAIVFSLSRSVLPRDNHVQLDLTSTESLKQVLNFIKPEVIIHCAAIVDVNKCEEQKDFAHALHVEATKELAEFHTVKKFIYISTDSVFDGKKGNYEETDKPNPLNYYAYTKLKGEEFVLDKQKENFVIRTNIIGYKTPLNNSLFEWAYLNLREKNKIKGFQNVYFNPIFCADLSAIIRDLLLKEIKGGVYNIGSAEGISKYDFIKEIARKFSLPEELITPVDIDNSKLKACRPLNTTLSTEKIQLMGIKIPTISCTINNIIKDFKINLSQYGE